MALESGRRRGISSWFVEPYKQVKLGLIFVGINVSFSVLFCLVVGYFFLDVYAALSNYFKLSAGQGQQVLSKLELPMFWGFGLIALFILVTILASVKYTHAIYGPLVSIHRFLDGLLGDGPADPLVIREGDELVDLAEKINRLSDIADGSNVSESHALKEVQTFLDAVLDGKEKSEPLSKHEEGGFKNRCFCVALNCCREKD